jgi:hypothetical protein
VNGIFARIKSVKIKRRTLVVSLIIAEIVGILVLVWFLRNPLAEKLLAVPPKAYSVDSFDLNKSYVVNQGDFIKGTVAPRSKIVAIIRQGKKQLFSNKPVTTKEGNWSFQIPENLEPGRYILTLGYEAPDEEIFAENYKINVKTRYQKIPFLKDIFNNSGKFKIENISGQFPQPSSQGTKNNFFRLMVDKKTSLIKQLESGTIYSHSAPQNLLKTKPSVSTNSAIFFAVFSGSKEEPIRFGWLKFPIPNLKNLDQYEITVYNDDENTKSIKLYDENKNFLWGNMI